MKRSLHYSLIFFAAVLLLLTACVVPQSVSGQTAQVTQNGIDLWTAPPETGSPVSLPSEAPQTSAAPAEQAPSEPVSATETPVPITAAPSPLVTATPSPAPSHTPAPTPVPTRTPTPKPEIDEDGIYTAKDDVALYLHVYGHLPSNFITKKEAQKLGWTGGDLRPYAPGKCIGGDYFGNYEKLLPTKKGRSYYECDIDTLNRRSRGSKRIIWSNDGLIYYTDDHYESFTLLYGGK